MQLLEENENKVEWPDKVIEEVWYFFGNVSENDQNDFFIILYTYIINNLSPLKPCPCCYFQGSGIIILGVWSDI